ncbi:MAG: hypothetical protein U5K72_03555 [Balneolaceae bacterium]|nr:hypothetical protein [Balneolaceae bacterium]
MSDRSGFVESITIPESVSEHPDLYELVIDVEVNDRVNKFVTGPDRIGHIVVTSKTSREAEKLALELAGKVNIVIQRPWIR